MVLSYYLIKYPYRLAWHAANRLKKRTDVVLYCANALDYELFQPVQQHLQPLSVVANNTATANTLQACYDINAHTFPVFPAGVVMLRQAAYKFPCEPVIKVGMRHGAYHFKPFANAYGYNLFTEFFMTSSTEVREAKQASINSGVPIGFPKLDPAFDGTYDDAFLENLRSECQLDADKPTVLFTATWDESGVAAIELWYDQLGQLTETYNILVTVHPWTSQALIDTIKNTAKVTFISATDAVPYIMLADICVGDSSSILAECCALDKPIVTFSVPKNKRTVPKIHDMLDKISWRIDRFAELAPALSYGLQHPNAHQTARFTANQMMFDELDGLAGKRAADRLVKLFPQLAL